MEFTVRKLTPNVGAEISGLDLRRPLDPDTMAEVRKVWLDNVVVVFPEQPHRRRPADRLQPPGG